MGLNDEQTLFFWWFKFKIWGLQRLNMIWRLFKDLDLPEFWPYGGLKVPKIKNEALKNNLLSPLRPMDKNPRRHEQVYKSFFFSKLQEMTWYDWAFCTYNEWGDFLQAFRTRKTVCSFGTNGILIRNGE